jgi:hypothetical protein
MPGILVQGASCHDEIHTDGFQPAGSLKSKPLLGDLGAAFYVWGLTENDGYKDAVMKKCGADTGQTSIK